MPCPADAGFLAPERHALALDGVEAHPERGGLLRGDLADVGRLLGGGHRAGRERRPSACRPSATRGGSGPCPPGRRRAARRRAGATSAATSRDRLRLDPLALLDEPAGPRDQLRAGHPASTPRPRGQRHLVDPALARRGRTPQGPGAPVPIGRAVERVDRLGAGDAAREDRLVGVRDVGRREPALVARSPTRRRVRRAATSASCRPGSPRSRGGVASSSPVGHEQLAVVPRLRLPSSVGKIASSAPARSASRRATTSRRGRCSSRRPAATAGSCRTASVDDHAQAALQVRGRRRRERPCLDHERGSGAASTPAGMRPVDRVRG